MIEIPVVRWGKPYESLEKADVVHFETGETMAKMHQANAGLVKMDARKAATARAVLRDFTPDQLIEMCVKAADPTGDHKSFTLVDGLSEQRMLNRVSLQQQLDSVKRSVDRNRTFDAMDSINQQALDIVLSGKVRKAFNVDSEPAALRERYGPGWGEQALLARRLVEAGVRFVSLNTGYFDDHGNIERALRDKLPRHDKAVGVLIQDLAEKGMLDDTLVIVAGEFGHTPRINDKAGRDHWPLAQSIMLAGGGFRHGQVIGATNDKAEHPITPRMGVEDFCATVYHALGLNNEDTLIDMSGRPVHLLPGGQVPAELLS